MYSGYKFWDYNHKNHFKYCFNLVFKVIIIIFNTACCAVPLFFYGKVCFWTNSRSQLFETNQQWLNGSLWVPFLTWRTGKNLEELKPVCFLLFQLDLLREKHVAVRCQRMKNRARTKFFSLKSLLIIRWTVVCGRLVNLATNPQPALPWREQRFRPYYLFVFYGLDPFSHRCVQFAFIFDLEACLT